jgi:hypothetical protein
MCEMRRLDLEASSQSSNPNQKEVTSKAKAVEYIWNEPRPFGVGVLGVKVKEHRSFTISEEAQWHTVFKRAVKPYLDVKKVLTITVEPFRKKRSVDQNARYWAILTEISQKMPPHMGGVWWSPEVWHEAMKSRFLGMESGPFGPVAKSTTRLSVVEFMGYCDEIQAWAIDEGIMFDTEAA